MRIFDHTGEKIDNWSVIKMIPGKGDKKYLFRCDCGFEKLVSSQRVYRKASCLKCCSIQKYNSYKSERNGKLTCLGYGSNGKRHGLNAQCDCGKILFFGCYAQFQSTSSCKSCRSGFYPGKKTGNSTLIERIDGAFWKKRCVCGEVFVADSRKTNCGCIKKAKLIKEAESKIGNTYYYLTVKGLGGFDNGHLLLLLRCKCGKEFTRPNGHEFKGKSCGCGMFLPTGEKARVATLKNWEVVAMREFYKSKVYSIDELANMFKKSANYISKIVTGKIWTHV